MYRLINTLEGPTLEVVTMLGNKRSKKQNKKTKGKGKVKKLSIVDVDYVLHE